MASAAVFDSGCGPTYAHSARWFSHPPHTSLQDERKSIDFVVESAFVNSSLGTACVAVERYAQGCGIVFIEAFKFPKFPHAVVHDGQCLGIFNDAEKTRQVRQKRLDRD